MRLNSILSKSGLINIFHNMDIPAITDDKTCLTDFIQNIYIVVDGKSNPPPIKEHTAKIIRTNRKFIANRPFIYYFRCIKTNTMIITGQYLKPN